MFGLHATGSEFNKNVQELTASCQTGNTPEIYAWDSESRQRVQALKPLILGIDSLNIYSSYENLLYCCPGDPFELRDGGDLFLVGGDLPNLFWTIPPSGFDFARRVIRPYMANVFLGDLGKASEAHFLDQINQFETEYRAATNGEQSISDKMQLQQEYTRISRPAIFLTAELGLRNALLSLKMHEAQEFLDPDKQSKQPAVLLLGSSHQLKDNVWNDQRGSFSILARELKKLFFFTRQEYDSIDCQTCQEIDRGLKVFLAGMNIWRVKERPAEWKLEEICQQIPLEQSTISGYVMETIHYGIKKELCPPNQDQSRCALDKYNEAQVVSVDYE